MLKPTLKTLYVLFVCLCSSILHTSVSFGINTSSHEETLPLIEARGESDSSDSRAHTHAHTHEHEDDLTSLGNVTPHVLVGLASRMRDGYLSNLSQTPNPTLPPPKN